MSATPLPRAEAVGAIAALEVATSGLTDGELRERALGLREHPCSIEASSELPDSVLQGFALVREAARRRLGLRPYDEQIAAGLVLASGGVAEMATGEGKTLAAVAPVFLAALEGSGSHVLTFNDYLARRDAAWMGPIYELLGVRVGVVQEDSTREERRAAYACDVTYLTAKESGFDVLRDGLCLERSDQVHRPFHSALVDEADSILIDEARVPLVIAGGSMPPDERPVRFAEVARSLTEELEFGTDEARRNIFLTDRGAAHVERLLGCANLFAPENAPLLAAMRNALHAEFLLTRDVDYIVRRGTVELVDQLTGRVAERRQWPDGLQAAVEAKEGMTPGDEGRVLGTITVQHLMALYPRLCGMTATAHSSADELAESYDLEVTPIPSHLPSCRVDLPDAVYASAEARDRAVVEEIVRAHANNRPLLVGTASVADSERLTALLTERGVACRTLNAKNDEAEAAIVAEAGRPGAVTISTNMAGRGTDIKLGGQDERDRRQVVELGGLYVVGTCLHESRRIDDQLRGRAGRQGDPGTSRFFIALDDEVPARCGLDRLRALMPALLLEEDPPVPIDLERVQREIAHAQRQVEGEGFDLRRRLFSYSQILETQRAYLQEWRQEVLEGSHDAGLLASELPELWEERRQLLGGPLLEEVERRLTLLSIDHSWSEHLADMQSRRDELPLATLDGRDPVAEYYRAAISSFEALLDAIDETRLETFRSLELRNGSIDWEATGMTAPSATWTYLVNDNAFAGDVLRTLAHRPGFGLWGVLLLWPVLFVWGLYLRHRRRQQPMLR